MTTQTGQILSVLRESLLSGEAWLTQRHIAEMTGIEGDRVSALLSKLERAGKLVVHRSFGPGRYRFALMTPGFFELVATHIALGPSGRGALASVFADRSALPGDDQTGGGKENSLVPKTEDYAAGEG